MIIVDEVDARFLEREIKEDVKINNILLIQNELELNELFGVIEINKNKGLLIKSGNISFNSTGGGKNALSTFRNWIINRSINNVNLVFCDNSFYGQLVDKQIFNKNDCKSSRCTTIETRFNDWKNGKNWI